LSQTTSFFNTVVLGTYGADWIKERLVGNQPGDSGLSENLVAITKNTLDQPKLRPIDYLPDTETVQRMQAIQEFDEWVSLQQGLDLNVDMVPTRITTVLGRDGVELLISLITFE
tara:strand:- start:916 stop:1257 length:342 start_codon:yes stop_codon:yes gene_type:complete